MDEYLRFENAIFFFKQLQFFEIFCSKPVCITVVFTLLFLIMYLQLSIPHCIVNKIPTP